MLSQKCTIGLEAWRAYMRASAFEDSWCISDQVLGE
jgi:hypothetical protein